MFFITKYWKRLYYRHATFEDFLHSVNAILKFVMHCLESRLVIFVFHLNYKHCLFLLVPIKTEDDTIASLFRRPRAHTWIESYMQEAKSRAKTSYLSALFATCGR